MKNIRKYLVIILAVSVMLLSSCAPSPMVIIKSKNAKNVVQNMNGSNKEDKSRIQQSGSTSKNADTTKNGDSGKTTASSKGQSGNFGQTSGSGSSAFSISNSGGLGNADLSSGGGNGTGSGTGSSSSGSGTGSGSSAAGGGSSKGRENDPYEFPASDGTYEYVTMDGTHINIPKDVQRAAANGIYADIVSMLGGELVATSEDNKHSYLFNTMVKNASGALNYMPLPGQPMTEAQANSIKSMPAARRPQAVIGDSATFSGSQGEAAGKILLNNKVQPVSMPESEFGVTNSAFNAGPLNMVYQNVDIIDQMLKDKCKDASNIKDDFYNYYTENIYGGSNSLFAKYCKEGFEKESASDMQSNSGSNETFKNRRYTFYASSFSLYDGADDSASSYNSYNSFLQNLHQYTLNNPGVGWNDYNSFYGQLGKINFGYVFTEPTGIYKDIFESSLQMVDMLYSSEEANSNYIDSLKTMLKYPNNVIASNPQVQGKGGTYNVKLIGSSGVEGGAGTPYPVDEIKMNVQPVGVHSWISGSPESLLEPLWLSTIFADSDGDKTSASDFKAELKKFYSTFYHHDITDAEYNKIMNPNQD